MSQSHEAQNAEEEAFSAESSFSEAMELEATAAQEKQGQRGGQGSTASEEIKSTEQLGSGVSTLSSEALDAVASQAAEEAVAESQGSQAQSANK